MLSRFSLWTESLLKSPGHWVNMWIWLRLCRSGFRAQPISFSDPVRWGHQEPLKAIVQVSVHLLDLETGLKVNFLTCMLIPVGFTEQFFQWCWQLLISYRFGLWVISCHVCTSDRLSGSPERKACLSPTVDLDRPQWSPDIWIQLLCLYSLLSDFGAAGWEAGLQTNGVRGRVGHEGGVGRRLLCGGLSQDLWSPFWQRRAPWGWRLPGGFFSPAGWVSSDRTSPDSRLSSLCPDSDRRVLCLWSDPDRCLASLQLDPDCGLSSVLMPVRGGLSTASPLVDSTPGSSMPSLLLLVPRCRSFR